MMDMLSYRVNIKTIPSKTNYKYSNQTRKPLLKNDKSRILFPYELELIKAHTPKHKHRVLIDALIYTSARYIELCRLIQHAEWFQGEKGKGGYINLPPSASLKERCRMKSRCIILNEFGRECIAELLKIYKNDDLPVRQSMNANLIRFCENAKLDPIGLSLRSFRKTSESWLVALFETSTLKILSHLGHSSMVSLMFYVSVPYNEDDKAMMKRYFYGW
jgi:hypothetical protein